LAGNNKVKAFLFFTDTWLKILVSPNSIFVT